MRVLCECSSGFGNAYSILMMAGSSSGLVRRRCLSLLISSILVSSGVMFSLSIDYKLPSELNDWALHSDEEDVWIDGGQPWPQFGRSAGRIANVPDHDPISGGAGEGTPGNATSLMPILSPKLNWEYGTYSIGTDSLGTPIANFSNSLTIGNGAEERCGGSSLYTIITQTVETSGSDHSFLRIIEGEDADLAWQVDLGETDPIKATPVVVDIDDDGMPEVVVVYDSEGSMYVEAWSPRLSCSVTGWSENGHSGEKIWSWSDDEKAIGSSEGPYVNALFGGHKPTTQPLLADLDLDGDAELVLAAIDDSASAVGPVVLAITLQMNGTPSVLWEVNLNKGSHPSDPAFVQLDENTGHVVLTTIEEQNGRVWAWKIESSTGDSIWDDGLDLQNTDGDTNSPHIRMPGPIIANLDSDPSLEMIVTIPTDGDGDSSIDGAEFRGLEIDDGAEIWRFEAVNGFADAPPTAIDTDGDGQHDRVCWVTWWQSSFPSTARHGASGCHDVDGDVPDLAWNRDLESTRGVPNDEIAVAATSWMDINGFDEQELLVPFGRTLWAFDGETGTSSGTNNEWANGIELEHRTWSSPSLADVDGDATLDVIMGSMVVSTGMSDVRPILDGRWIEFNPSEPDPGEEVTITAFIENSGTEETGEVTDVYLYADGIKIASEGIGNLEPVGPSGSGSFSSFSTEWSGGLGDHTFEIVLDPYKNLSQSRFDNDIQSKTISIIETYNASFELPTDPLRIDPGEDAVASIPIRSTGRIAGTWSLEIEGHGLPDGWQWFDETPGGLNSVEIGVGDIWSPQIRISAPVDALGSDSGFIGLTLSLDDDSNVSVSSVLPVEANRTRGISIRGPDGTANSDGFGLVGEYSKAWLLVENVGNAAENQISMTWDGTDWGSDLRIFDSDGVEMSAISLGPGEKKEMSARLQVPGGAQMGQHVSTPLTMCVGVGEEEECGTVQLRFFASGTIVEPQHHRSIPAEGLVWSVTADLPQDADNISWSVSDAGMGIAKWSWQGSGNISISGDNITLSGEPGSRVSGDLSLDLPPDAPPSFHQFLDPGPDEDFSLRLSIEVLQIHRVNLTVVSPIEQPYIVDVKEEALVMLRLENRGNGGDTFLLSHVITSGTGLSGVDVKFNSETINLGAGSLQTVPLSVTLPEDTPAGQSIVVVFSAQSALNSSAIGSAELTFEVMQDHRWEIIPEGFDGVINGTTAQHPPGHEFSFPFNVTNIGNLVDDLELEAKVSFQREEGDTSTGWNLSGDSVENIEVGGSHTLFISGVISSEAYNGTVMEIEVTAIAKEQVIANLEFFIEVTRVPGWQVSANNANLEIDSSGSQIQLDIIQLGNSPSRPYVSFYVTGEKGWEIEDPGLMPIVVPGSSTPLILNVTPPENAMHGRSVEINIKVRDGDSEGLAEITLPLKVAIVYEFSIENKAPEWTVSQMGGYSHIEISNLGNSATTITLEIPDLPLGWSAVGETEIVLGIGETRGVPIDLIPSEDWSGDEMVVTITGSDQSGRSANISTTVKMSEFSWAVSPIIKATEGDLALVDFYGTNGNLSTVSVGSEDLVRTERGWLLPITGSGSNTISVDGEDLFYEAHIVEVPNRQGSCILDRYSTKKEIFIQNAIGPSEIVVSCQISNGSGSLGFTALLIGDDGSMIDFVTGVATDNMTEEGVNLSAEGWSPEPGTRILEARIIDNRGNHIGSQEWEFEIRRNDWNVGLVGLELEGQGEDQKIKVLTKRSNQNLLEGAECMITLLSGVEEASYLIDMTQIYVPTPSIDRPDADDGAEVTVTISCSYPWDVDSDPNDDEARLVLSGGSVADEDIAVLGTALLSATLVVGIYIGFARMVSNSRERARLMQMAQEAIENKKAMPRELEEDSDSEIEQTEVRLEDEDSGGEEIEIVEEDSDEFETRLRRLLER